MFSAADSMAPKRAGRSLLMAALVAMRVDDGRLPVEHIHKSSSPGRGGTGARRRSTSYYVGKSSLFSYHRPESQIS